MLAEMFQKSKFVFYVLYFVQSSLHFLHKVSFLVYISYVLVICFSFLLLFDFKFFGNIFVVIISTKLL